MRTVTVYPAGSPEATIAILDERAQQRNPYYIDQCLHVDVCHDDDPEIPLFLGWEPDEIAGLVAVVGHRPTWAVFIHLSWVGGCVPPARRLALALLRGGGAAKDDYSYHAWTAAEVEADYGDGRRFSWPD